MKKALLVIVSLASTVGLASASDDFSYTATADPNLSPDGIDQNSNPVNVWTLAFTSGVGGTGYGSDFGTVAGLANAWGFYSYPPDGIAGDGGSDDATTAFAGGALSIGQTVSINFAMSATDTGKYVGVSLLNGSGDAITFEIPGGGQYVYTDAASTLASAGSMGYQYQVPFNIAFTVTGIGTYSAVAGSDAWSGTFSGSLIGMDVFNHGAGNGSDVGFNNLTVTTVPEPSTWAMLAAGGAVLLGYRRNLRRV